MKPIARFDFFRMDTEGKMLPAYVGVGTPSPGERCWNCTIVCNFSGTEETQTISGNGSLQVLALALRTLRERFLAELNHGPSLFYDEEDVDPMTKETLSHCFPSL